MQEEGRKEGGGGGGGGGEGEEEEGEGEEEGGGGGGEGGGMSIFLDSAIPLKSCNKGELVFHTQLCPPSTDVEHPPFISHHNYRAG